MISTSDLTSVASLGALAVIQSLAAFAYIETRLRSVGREAEAKVAAAKTDADSAIIRETRRVENLVLDERTERRREMDKLGLAIEGFHTLTLTFAKVGQTVDHLAERIDDHRTETNRAMDEVKHSVRSISERFDAMTSPRRRRSATDG